MKTEKEILKEIEIRENLQKKFTNYGQAKSNKTTISTLKAVLGLSSHVKWHEEKEYEMD